MSAPDPDNRFLERIRYSFSDNGVHGVDLVFHVKYRNVGSSKVSPIINFSVYCKATKDKFVSDIVKDLWKLASE